MGVLAKPSRRSGTDVKYDADNFDRGAPLCGGLAEIYSCPPLWAAMNAARATHREDSYTFNAVLGGTGPVRDAVNLQCEVSLLVSTLLITMIAPLMVMSTDELGIQGSEQREAGYLRALSWLVALDTVVVILSFATSWVIFMSNNFCTSSKAYVFWVSRAAPYIQTASRLNAAALALFLVVELVLTAGQIEALVWDALAMVVSIFFIVGLYTKELWSRMDLFSSLDKRLRPHLGTAQLQLLKDSALTRLRDIHAAYHDGSHPSS